MSAGPFSRSSRALSSLDGSEYIFVYFQVKWFDPIRRSDVPAVVFIWTALIVYMDFGEFFEKNRFLMKINSSLQATSAANTHEILTLGVRNWLNFS